jgi:hypothetical protein
LTPLDKTLSRGCRSPDSRDFIPQLLISQAGIPRVLPQRAPYLCRTLRPQVSTVWSHRIRRTNGTRRSRRLRWQDVTRMGLIEVKLEAQKQRHRVRQDARA